MASSSQIVQAGSSSGSNSIGINDSDPTLSNKPYGCCLILGRWVKLIPLHYCCANKKKIKIHFHFYLPSTFIVLFIYFQLQYGQINLFAVYG